MKKAEQTPLAFMRPKKRKAVSLKDRITPCACCGYPLSHQHHLFPIAEWGGNNETIPLCANCHELYHICFDVVKQLEAMPEYMEGRSAKLFMHLADLWEKPDAKLSYLLTLAERVLAKQHEVWAEEDGIINDPQALGMEFLFAIFEQVDRTKHVHFHRSELDSEDAIPDFDTPRKVI